MDLYKEFKLAIENNALDNYIRNFRKQKLPQNFTVIRYISVLRKAIEDPDLSSYTKSSGIIRVITAFCERLDNFMENRLVSCYLYDMKIIMKHFITNNDVKAIEKLNNYMIVTKPPLLSLSECHKKLYWNYLHLLFSCNLKFSKSLIENIILSTIEHLKIQHKMTLSESDIEYSLDFLCYFIRRIRIVLDLSDPELLCSFIESVFSNISNYKLSKTCNTLEKYYISMLAVISCQGCAVFTHDKWRSNILKTVNVFRMIFENTSYSATISVIYNFYEAIDKNNLECIPKYLNMVLEKLNSQNILVDTLLHMFKVLSDYMAKYSDYASSDQNNITFLQGIVKTCLVISNNLSPLTGSTCSICKYEYHSALKVLSYIVTICSKVLDKNNRKYHDLHALVLERFDKCFEITKLIWEANCNSRFKYSNILFIDYYNIVARLTKYECITSKEKISFIRSFLSRYVCMKALAKNEELVALSVEQYIPASFNMLVRLYEKSEQYDRALQILYLGQYFMKRENFYKRIFMIKFHHNELINFNCYDLFINKNYTEEDNLHINMNKQEILAFLLNEIQAHYKSWISFSSMLGVARSVFKLTSDSMLLAKSCVLMQNAKINCKEFVGFVNKALCGLQSKVQKYTGAEWVLAQTLLASLNCIKYLSDTEDFKNEIKEGKSCVVTKKKEFDRDGLIDPNDTCDIDPAITKLNVKTENSIVDHLVKASELWKTTLKYKNDFAENNSCYLNQALYHMEIAAMAFAERGYENHKLDVLFLVYELSLHLKNELSTIRCMSDVLITTKTCNEIEKMIKVSHDLVSKYLIDMNNQDEKVRNLIYDYLISYSEYRFNCHDYHTGLIAYENVLGMIQNDATCRKIIKARLYWLQSLFMRPISFNSSEYAELIASNVHRIVLSYESIEDSWREDSTGLYGFIRTMALFFNIVHEMGRYFLHMYMNRFANLYLRVAMKTAEKQGFAHRIAEMLCLLSRVDLICEMTDDCQVKIDTLRDILFPGQFSEPFEKSQYPIINQEKQVLQGSQIYRDSSLMIQHLNINQLMRIPSVGSPALRQRTLKLPEFLHHSGNCNCICCYNVSFHRILIEAATVEARLNSYLDNQNIADEYFKLCTQMLQIIEDRNQSSTDKFKFTHNKAVQQTFFVTVVSHFYDYGLHLMRCKKVQQAHEVVNLSKPLFMDMPVLDKELLQDIACLKGHISSCQRTVNSIEVISETNEIDSSLLSPVLLHNEALPYKTPAGTKLIPKVIPKFVIHEDVTSPNVITKPRIKFNLDENSEEEDMGVIDNLVKTHHTIKSTSSSKRSDKSVYYTPEIEEVTHKLKNKSNMRVKNTVKKKTKNKKILEQGTSDDEVFAVPGLTQNIDILVTSPKEDMKKQSQTKSSEGITEDENPLTPLPGRDVKTTNEIESDLLSPNTLHNKVMPYKTPAGSKVIPKQASKFVIHEDDKHSPNIIKNPRIKFNLDGNDEKDVKTKDQLFKLRRTAKSSCEDNYDNSVYFTPVAEKASSKEVNKNVKIKKTVGYKTNTKKALEIQTISDEVFEVPSLIKNMDALKISSKESLTIIQNKDSSKPFEESLQTPKTKTINFEADVYKTPKVNNKKTPVFFKNTDAAMSPIKKTNHDEFTPMKSSSCQQNIENDIFYTPVAIAPFVQSAKKTKPKMDDLMNTNIARLTIDNKRKTNSTRKAKSKAIVAIKVCEKIQKENMGIISKTANAVEVKEYVDKNMNQGRVDNLSVITIEDSIVEATILESPPKLKRVVRKTKTVTNCVPGSSGNRNILEATGENNTADINSKHEPPCENQTSTRVTRKRLAKNPFIL